MLESIEKLREKIQLDVNNPWSDLKGDLLAMCDKVEREIAERYMELPVDADGVLIRLGDTLREVDDSVPMKVTSLTFYEDCVDVNACGMNPNLLRHVKPRTIEDALREFASQQHGITTEENDALLAKYADELRNMGVGE